MSRRGRSGRYTRSARRVEVGGREPTGKRRIGLHLDGGADEAAAQDQRSIYILRMWASRGNALNADNCVVRTKRL